MGVSMSLTITPSRILFYALLALIALSLLVALTMAVAGEQAGGDDARPDPPPIETQPDKGFDVHGVDYIDPLPVVSGEVVDMPLRLIAT